MDGCIDSIVTIGKKYLPPPVILFIMHLVYATFCSVIFLINVIIDSNHGWCWNGWTVWLIWVFAVLLSVVVAFIKYKENKDIVGCILSFIAFWLTLFGIQLAPFMCHYATSKTGLIISNIARAIIDVFLSIIYVVWTKSELDSYFKS